MAKITFLGWRVLSEDEPSEPFEILLGPNLKIPSRTSSGKSEEPHPEGKPGLQDEGHRTSSTGRLGTNESAPTCACPRLVQTTRGQIRARSKEWSSMRTLEGKLEYAVKKYGWGSPSATMLRRQLDTRKKGVKSKTTTYLVATFPKKQAVDNDE